MTGEGSSAHLTNYSYSISAAFGLVRGTFVGRKGDKGGQILLVSIREKVSDILFFFFPSSVNIVGQVSFGLSKPLVSWQWFPVRSQMPMGWGGSNSALDMGHWL